METLEFGHFKLTEFLDTGRNKVKIYSFGHPTISAIYLCLENLISAIIVDHLGKALT